jgi:hypothetical protein
VGRFGFGGANLAPMDADQLAQQAAERVREVITRAEQRAAEIVREAEAEADRIRGAAERDARERLANARKALDQLEGQLAGAKTETQPPTAETQPGTAETQPGGPEAPTGPPVPEPGPQPGPEPEPSPEPGNGDGGGEEAARLVAMKMALDGTPREKVIASLDSSIPTDRRERIVAEVFERARR